MFKRSRKYSVLEKLNKMNTNEKFTWSKKQKVDFCFCYKNKRKSFYSIEKAFTNWEEFRSTEVRVNKDREKSEEVKLKLQLISLKLQLMCSRYYLYQDTSSIVLYKQRNFLKVFYLLFCISSSKYDIFYFFSYLNNSA